MSVEESFMQNVSPEPNTGCWLWTAAIFEPSGYGCSGKGLAGEQRAHRTSWVMFNGPLRPTDCVLHKCDVRSCVNPKHLFIGDRKLNAVDMVKKGRHANQVKTHCKAGHMFTEANTYIRPSGGRYCRECGAVRSAVNRARRGGGY